jgi:hypothetical protein
MLVCFEKLILVFTYSNCIRRETMPIYIQLLDELRPYKNEYSNKSREERIKRFIELDQYEYATESISMLQKSVTTHAFCMLMFTVLAAVVQIFFLTNIRGLSFWPVFSLQCTFILCCVVIETSRTIISNRTRKIEEWWANIHAIRTR